MTTCPPDLQLTVWWLVPPVFCCVWQFMLPGDTLFSNPLPVLPASFSIAFFFTCKARKLHQYFIVGSILLCTDSMGKEINSGVLIMQCGDTDLILCLSTCTDILMHSAPLLSSTQEVFTLFVQSLEKKKKKTLPVWQRLHHCLNHLKTLTKILGLRAGFFETLWKYISSFLQKQCEC